MSLADHKGTQRGSMGTYIRICGEVIRLLLKYCMYWVSAPSLHRESTDSLIVGYFQKFSRSLKLHLGY